MDISREEIIWAAGLFEGEGSIVWTSYPSRHRTKRYTRCQVSLHTTDKDVLERFVKAIGFGTINGPYTYVSRKIRKRKPSWYWAVAGHERVQTTIAMLWPWLGERRQKRAKEVLTLELSARSHSKTQDKITGKFI